MSSKRLLFRLYQLPHELAHGQLHKPDADSEGSPCRTITIQVKSARLVAEEMRATFRLRKWDVDAWWIDVTGATGIMLTSAASNAEDMLVAATRLVADCGMIPDEWGFIHSIVFGEISESLLNTQGRHAGVK